MTNKKLNLSAGDPRIRELLNAADRIAGIAETFAKEDLGFSSCLKFISRSLTDLAEEHESHPAAPEGISLPKLSLADSITPIPGPVLPGEAAARPGSPCLRFGSEITPKRKEEIREQFRRMNRIFPNDGEKMKFRFSSSDEIRNDRIFRQLEKLALEFRAGGGDLSGKTRLLPEETAAMLNFQGVRIWESCDDLSVIAGRFYSDFRDRRNEPELRFKRLLKRYGNFHEEWGKFAALPAFLSDSGQCKLLLICPADGKQPASQEKKANDQV